jgi:hypothetical protein
MTPEEVELEEWNAKGIYQIDSWKEFWWARRAAALIEADQLRGRLVELGDYIERCRVRIEGQPSSRDAKP